MCPGPQNRLPIQRRIVMSATTMVPMTQENLNATTQATASPEVSVAAAKPRADKREKPNQPEHVETHVTTSTEVELPQQQIPDPTVLTTIPAGAKLNPRL